MARYKIVCVIPSLNPDAKLVEVVCALNEVGFTDIIVVNDGSRHECGKYFEQVQELGAEVLTHEINRGKGAALKTAFEYYLHNYDTNYYQGVVTADADGQHLAIDIKKTADAILARNSRGLRMALGTRDFNEKTVPFKSRNGNKITTVVFNILFSKVINDTQTGLRCISNAFLNNCLSLKQNRFEYEINMLIDAVKNDVEIIEVPIQTVYYNGNRETHFRPFADSFRIYSVMFGAFFRYAISGLISWGIDQTLFFILVNTVFNGFNADKNIVISTIAARICSSLVNYTLNKRYVFGRNSRGCSLIKYYILCISQMLISAGCVALLHDLSLLNPSFIKIVVDAIILLVNYKVQQEWVFKE